MAQLAIRIADRREPPVLAEASTLKWGQFGITNSPLVNSEWVDPVVFWLAAGVKGGRQPGAANP
jgi:hypothetical protein